MKRALALAAALVFAGDAEAEMKERGREVGLQVGGALRMPEVAKTSEAGPPDQVGFVRGTEPAVEAEPMVDDLIAVVMPSLSWVEFQESEDPEVAYTVTTSLSLGFGYQFVEAEDHIGDLAVPGTLNGNHQSHHLVFRAHWHFQ